MYGYAVANGYRGRMHSGEWLLFPTEEEYREAFNEEEEDEKN